MTQEEYLELICGEADCEECPGRYHPGYCIGDFIGELDED
jgi:hypothetical protein